MRSTIVHVQGVPTRAENGGGVQYDFDALTGKVQNIKSATVKRDEQPMETARRHVASRSYTHTHTVVSTSRRSQDTYHHVTSWVADVAALSTQYILQQSWMAVASWGVYPSVRRVSTPAVGVCAWEPSQVLHNRWNVGHVVAIVQGFFRGVPSVRFARLTRPYMHPSRAYDLQLHRLSAVLTCRRRQYMHARGHSHATCPPEVRQASAVR